MRDRWVIQERNVQYSLKGHDGTKKGVTGKYTVKKESCLYLGNSEYGVLECDIKVHGSPDIVKELGYSRTYMKDIISKFGG